MGRARLLSDASTVVRLLCSVIGSMNIFPGIPSKLLEEGGNVNPTCCTLIADPNTPTYMSSQVGMVAQMAKQLTGFDSQLNGTTDV